MKVKNKGITLIALVVTIIIMLIIAGIAISLLAGENSVLNNAKVAADNTDLEAAREIIKLAVNAVRIESRLNKFTKSEIRDLLEEEIKNLSGEDAVVDIDGEYYRIEFRGYIFRVPDDFSDVVRIDPFDAEKWDKSGITPETAFVWASENPNDGELYHTIIGFRDSLLSNTIVKIPSRCHSIDIQYISENNSGRITTYGTNRQISRMFNEWFGDNDRRVTGTVEKVQIPETVTKLNGAFLGFSSIKEVELPYSLTEISGASFYGCNGLTTITIPNRVTKIGSYSFYGCSNLKDINMPGNVKSIGEFAFGQTQWYKDQPDGEIYIGKVFYHYKGTMPQTYTIKDGTKGIAGGAFAIISEYGAWYSSTNYNLKEITFPSSLEEIGDCAFCSCYNLSDFTLPNSLKTIGESAFICCSSIRTVEFPESLEEIKPGAFNGCNNLATVTLKGDINKIGGKAFEGTKWLSNQNPDDGLIYIRNILYKYKSNGSTKIDVKSGTTAISEYVFSNQSQITEVNLPDTVTSIGTQAFFGCSNLKTVNMSNNVKEIEQEAFYDDTKLEIEQLPSSLEIIHSRVFYNCNSAFKNLEIPNGVTYIGEAAFYKAGIENLTISSSVNTIYQAAFSRCSSLENITMEEGLQILTDEAFSYCSALENVKLPGTISFYGLDIFKGCTNISVIKVNRERENTSLEQALEKAAPKETLIIYKGEDDNIYSITTDEPNITIPSESYKNQKITVKSKIANKGVSEFEVNGEKVVGKQFIMPAQDVVISNVVFIDEITFESEHEYSNNMDQIWEGTFDEDTAIKIEFDDETETENNYDRIWIYDSNGTFIRRYDGTALKGKTIYLNDKGVKIRFTTDGSVVKYGFKCVITKTDEIAYRGLETSHPYLADCEYAFTAEVEGAEKLQVTFSDDSVINSSDNVKVYKNDESTISSLTNWGTMNEVRLSLSNDNVAGRSVVTKGSATSIVLSGNGSESERTANGIKFNIQEYTTPENVLESDHDYENNSDIYYDKVIEGAEILKLTFNDETYVENSKDYIKIYSYESGSRTLIGTYTGTALAGKTVIVRASGVSIELTSNNANVYYGFYCTVEKGTIRYSEEEIVIESPHEYANSSTYYYTAQVPNANGLTVKFDSQSITETNYDWICFYNNDTDGMIGTAISGSIGGNEYTFDNVNNLKIRLKTDGSVTKWGFKCTVVGYYIETE